MWHNALISCYRHSGWNQVVGRRHLVDRIFVKIFRSPRWCLEGDVTELLGWYQVVMWWHLFDYGSVASLPRKPRPWQSGGLPKSGLLCKRWGGHLLCKRWGGRFYANLGEDTFYANVGVDTFMQTLGWTLLCKHWVGWTQKGTQEQCIIYSQHSIQGRMRKANESFFTI